MPQAVSAADTVQSVAGEAPTADPPTTREPRRDDTAADAGSLERMGRIDEQPVPAPADLPGDPPPAEPTS
ncbi:hypothetical protein [Streptomyces sp. NPDC086519]|uniref:hypothetical protein n=1 Tax=Streptomyces sp. NPDC086519 TaxID=3154863 RepID=UPI003416A353